MKTCPICKARCFDDMEVCYGCMHRFAEDEAAPMNCGEDDAEQREMHAREKPLQDAGETPRDPHMPESPHQRRAPACQETSHVFGAVDEGDDEALGCFDDGKGERDQNRKHSRDEFARGEVPLVMMTVGPIAAASLGNGFRLVVGIERE